nr:THAP domain-containing protein 11-like [Crassostrea virginica]
MVYCAAFGCNNKAEKGSGISFFTFPKDVNLRKQWAHYCRRKEFIPTSGHRLCSVHFSSNCFMHDPQLLDQIGLQETFKKRLKPNSVPDIPLLTEDEVSSDVINRAKVRGAYSKRQKAEIIEEALSRCEDTAMPESSSIVFNEPVEAVTHQTVSTNNKKIQVELRPPQRTRAHQTNF